MRASDVVVERELGGARRAEVVHQHVGGREQLVERAATLGGLDVEDDAALAAPPGAEAGYASELAFPAGGSTITTSAPASARSSVAIGPAIPSDEVDDADVVQDPGSRASCQSS